MAFRPADIIGLIWSHPIVSVVVLLLFTPPLFPIVVYFSPLLISTALFVLAMISMGSDVKETPRYSSDVPYKRGWIEDIAIDDDGPQLEGERVPKRLKASSKDESWFDKVKNWEGTGRAWVESVLSQESRRSFGSDDNASIRENGIPLLGPPREFFKEEDGRHAPQVVGESKPVKQAADEQSAKIADDKKDQSTKTAVASEISESVDGQSRAGVPQESRNISSEITPALESEDELIEIAPADIPPSPLFRSRSLPKLDDTAPGNAIADASHTQDVSSKDIKDSSQPMESVSSVPSTDSREEKKTPSDSNSTNDNDRDPEDHAELETADPGDITCTPEIAPSSGGGALTAMSLSQKENSQSTAGETKPEIESASPHVADQSLAEKAQTNGALTESSSGKPDVPGGGQPREMKSPAELLAPLREGTGYGVATPSAAVALSEKLKVPLADIMSLLAGEDKENVPKDGASGVKVSTSSETTTSQEEEWSSSDGESSVPHKAAGESEEPPVEKKDD